ncbi:[Pyruvate dehydrogenase [acetyl-transferring]]-phosphatase 1, mitochondrial [Coemansia sp. RSA 560]|nr:[Pyruvate dehydrogenase [acetyl-transferring]]-phosphatase 1, mitochondrial [Coemansia sp. RSA 560]KAJ2249189.1 [Pyruvate dehydrogenase [acetyl-transferring]]-phosphatase 1, mitochondrial [Coemansia sp. RSA 475]
MVSDTLRKRPVVGATGQQRSQSTDAGKGNKVDGDTSKKNETGSKRSLTFAIGGVLTLFSVAGYTFMRQPRIDIHGPDVPSSTATASQTTLAALESVATKRDDARKRLDGLASKERREEAKRLGLLTSDEVDAILEAHERSWYVSTGSGAPRLRVDTNQVSSNAPIEDYLAWSPLASTQFMFGVFDGHAGYMCAEQLSTRLAPMLSESLKAVDKLIAKDGDKLIANDGDKDLAPTDVGGTALKLRREAPGIAWDRVPLALTATFVRMDHELVIDSLAEFQRTRDAATMDALLGPAVSGSCGLVAVVDTEANEVVVANTGDSRALLGVRLGDGRWKAVRLSEDQTADNANETARMTREHPNETSVIHRGRVLGGLMPTRAFGDCRYKWPLDAQRDLFPTLYERGHRYATTPPNYTTPPYVTARPVIVRHKLGPNDKFVVVATDGLYDQLSDDEVVGSLGQWYDARSAGMEDNSLTTQDENAATHLVRAALSTDRLGRRDDTVIRRLLAIPPPHSRRFRDDISVQIITLNQ